MVPVMVTCEGGKKCFRTAKLSPKIQDPELGQVLSPRKTRLFLVWIKQKHHLPITQTKETVCTNVLHCSLDTLKEGPASVSYMIVTDVPD